MTLSNKDDIGPNSQWPPEAEISRLNAISRNRSLYNGDFSTLSVGRVDEEIPAIQMNWFSKITGFYPDFLFNEEPTITVEGNPRMTEFLQDYIPHMSRVMALANMDTIRYGYGIVSSNIMDPLTFVAVDPDRHFEVRDIQGRLQDDIILEYPERRQGKDEIVFKQTYNLAGGAEFGIYKNAGNGLGESITNGEVVGNRAGRQVAILQFSPERRSMFDDMKGNVGQMTRSKTALAKTIKRNSNPHLYGPENILRTDSTGKATLNTDGQFFPLTTDDKAPGYLQWDSKLDAVQWDYESSLNSVLQAVSLHPLLFGETDINLPTSGVALKRLLFPFIARVNRISRANDRLVLDLISILIMNMGANAQETFKYDESDIKIEWHFEDLFLDEEMILQAQQAQDNDRSEQDDTGGEG